MSVTIAIGDIHGCLNELASLLDIIDLAYDKGTVVFLGDYVDRGPDSAGVIERVMAGPRSRDWRWIALLGNHERMMLDALEGRDREGFWLRNGGEETLQSYRGEVSQTHRLWLAQRPLLHVDPFRVFAHAGLDRSKSLEDQDENTLIWRRPHPEDDHGDFFGRHLCHGHTPRDENPVTRGGRSNIDSGCVFGDRLTAAVFDDHVPGGPVRFIAVSSRYRWSG
ncbi:metallophosphoesterase family protein [Rhizobium sp. G21]|uniref:metallophosphoesterase family protein n=1 Tax=Rhizobium sp. G21 TaxID=2758439 RepID=UPI0015FEE506|nr:metallophosphoesterase family protein [Rhizobium sp. G21]MBB1249036.1 serine/threonine protein phosphatase [Rhizobium sp. G21]